MNFYLDTEFIEDGKTIDLLSIGLVADNGNTLYEFNRECNLSKASDWVVQNVFKPLVESYTGKDKQFSALYTAIRNRLNDMDYSERERIIAAMDHFMDYHGKSRARIAELVKEFVFKNTANITNDADALNKWGKDQPPVFYAYFADYDWVVFCQLFGRMIDLPKGFPYYCRDLKQLLDDKLEKMTLPVRGFRPEPNRDLDEKLKEIKSYKNYPQQENEHDALADAKWNKQLHQFILNL